MNPEVRLWECPSCGFRKRTINPATRHVTHPCHIHGGVTVFLDPADRFGIIGTPTVPLLVERGDWIGRERVQHGAVMAVHARRPDGSHDTIVFPPTATATATATATPKES